MEPATLYLVFKIADGPEQTYVGYFRDYAACETMAMRALERQSAGTTYVRYFCWVRGTEAPAWITRSKVINGVPLDPRFMPTG